MRVRKGKDKQRKKEESKITVKISEKVIRNNVTIYLKTLTIHVSQIIFTHSLNEISPPGLTMLPTQEPQTI